MHRTHASRTRKCIFQAPPLLAVLDSLKYFAGTQVRNVAAIGGNIVTASPISDLNPILLALSCTFVVASATGTRRIPAADFFVAYRATALGDGEVLVSIELPLGRRGQHVQFFKQARRKDDDIAIVNACFVLDAAESAQGPLVAQATFAFGGMAPVTKVATLTCSTIRGRVVDAQLLDTVSALLKEELALPVDVPGGMAEYRLSLACSAAFKFLTGVLLLLGASLDPRVAVSIAPMVRGASSGHQVFEALLVNRGDGLDRVGEPVPHASGLEHVCDTNSPIQ